VRAVQAADGYTNHIATIARQAPSFSQQGHAGSLPSTTINDARPCHHWSRGSVDCLELWVCLCLWGERKCQQALLFRLFFGFSDTRHGAAPPLATTNQAEQPKNTWQLCCTRHVSTIACTRSVGFSNACGDFRGCNISSCLGETNGQAWEWFKPYDGAVDKDLTFQSLRLDRMCHRACLARLSPRSLFGARISNTSKLFAQVPPCTFIRFLAIMRRSSEPYNNLNRTKSFETRPRNPHN
jgi:hypothetical protein